MEYGYCRISTPNQNIERQVRNIKKLYPNAHIVKEVYTGTKFQGRKEFDKILRLIKDDDTIIFDSVSRMDILVRQVLPQLSVSSCFWISQFRLKQPLTAPSIHCSLYHF